MEKLNIFVSVIAWILLAWCVFILWLKIKWQWDYDHNQLQKSLDALNGFEKDFTTGTAKYAFCILFSVAWIVTQFLT